jgi:hypothetical protein
MNRFEVGERALVMCRAEITIRRLRAYIGQEVTIMGGAVQLDVSRMYGDMYPVKADDGYEFFAAHQALQKRPPGREDVKLVRWADCPWQPGRVAATAPQPAVTRRRIPEDWMRKQSSK